MIEVALGISLIVLIWSLFSCVRARKEVTKLKIQLNEAVHLATHDSLTGLPNRLLFNDRLEQATVNADREKTPTALLYMDLNKFKPVNDRMGHSTGDELLQLVSSRLRNCVRKTDTVARLGGDEFAVILFEIHQEQDAIDMALKIQESFKEPFMLQGVPVYIGTSIGIAIYPNNTATVDTLIDCADAAMYRAKERNLDYALCNK